MTRTDFFYPVCGNNWENLEKEMELFQKESPVKFEYERVPIEDTVFAGSKYGETVAAKAYFETSEDLDYFSQWLRVFLGCFS